MSLTISVQNLIYYGAISIKNFRYVQLSWAILMLVVQDGGRKILLTQQVKKSILSHYQLDINKFIDKPTHIINNSMSYIDLLFCTNQNAISNYGVDVSIFDKCHHSIIFGKVNVCVPLLPVYIRQVWNYSQASVENIEYAISNFNWSKAFENLSVDEKVKQLKETLLNIFQNYIPNKKIKCDYCQPPWINQSSLKQKCKLTKIY